MTATSPSRSRWAIVLVALAVLVALPGLALLVLGGLPETQTLHRQLPKVAAFVHFGLFAWAAALLLAAGACPLSMRRRRRLAGAAVPSVVVAVLTLAGLVTQASWVAPTFVADGEQGAGEAFTVMTLNVEFGVDDLAEAERIAGFASAAQVVTLQEVTPESIDLLRAAGFEQRFTHRIGDGEPGASGTVVYSVFPLDLATWIPTGMQSLVVRVETPGAPFVFAAVHPTNPFARGDGWMRDGEALRAGVKPYLAEPLVVAGDFNAIDRHVTMQRLVADGLRFATDVAGAGLLATWPDNRRFPALIGIDHVLVNDRMTALDVWTLEAPGTDHRAVLATLVPRA